MLLNRSYKNLTVASKQAAQMSKLYFQEVWNSDTEYLMKCFAEVIMNSYHHLQFEGKPVHEYI